MQLALKLLFKLQFNCIYHALITLVYYAHCNSEVLYIAVSYSSTLTFVLQNVTRLISVAHARSSVLAP